MNHQHHQHHPASSSIISITSVQHRYSFGVWVSVRATATYLCVVYVGNLLPLRGCLGRNSIGKASLKGKGLQKTIDAFLGVSPLLRMGLNKNSLNPEPC